MLNIVKYFLSLIYLPIIGICTKTTDESGIMEITDPHKKKLMLKSGEYIRLGSLVYKCPKCNLVYRARKNNLRPKWEYLCIVHN